MKARYFLLALAATALVACQEKDPETPAVKGVLTVSGATNNAVSADATGRTLNLTVKSNVSWTATSSESWVSVDPSEFTSDNKSTVSTKVSVKVATNESADARTAKISIAGEGVDAVEITVNQAGVVPEESVLCVWDMDKFEPIANPTAALGFGSYSLTFVVHSNVDWTVTCSDWITVSPTSNKYDGENQNITIEANVAENETTSARNGEIRFAGNGVEDLVVSISQAKSPSIEVSVVESDHPYADVSFKVTPEEGVTWVSDIFDDENVAYLKENGLSTGDYLVYKLNYFLSKNNTVEDITAALITEGEDEVEFAELDPETHYTYCVIGVAYDAANNAFYATSRSVEVEYTTKAEPVATAAYSSVLGKYSVNVVSEFDETGADYSLEFVVIPQYINETYYMYFPNADFSPVDGNYVDKYVIGFDESKNQLILPNVQLGSEGFTWNFNEPVGANTGVVFYAEIGEAETDPVTGQVTKPSVVPQYLTFEISNNANTLTYVSPDLNGEKMHWSAMLCKYNNGTVSPTRYVSAAYVFNGGVDATRVAGASAVQNVKVKSDLMSPDFKIGEQVVKFKRF